MLSERNVDQTAMVGLFGSTRHLNSWMTVDEHSPDPYSMFVTRSSMKDFASNGSMFSPKHLWGMNDAQHNWTDGAGRLTWFQVGLNSDLDQPRALPVTQLISTAWETTLRFGNFEVTGVQTLAPVQIAGSAVEQIRAEREWFATADPAQPVHAVVDIDCGDDDTAATHYTSVIDTAQRLGKPEFTVEPREFDRNRPAISGPPTAGDLWLGSERHVTSVSAQLPEWTADCVGALTLLLVESLRAANVRTSALISVARVATPTGTTTA